jgi:type I restriction enzyme R subunit
MFKNELDFENHLIEYLTTGDISPAEDEERALIDPQKVFKSRLWTYRPDIKTTDQLWQNFKEILEQLNQDVLDKPLSGAEFDQVKREISSLTTPFKAGQFLYGLNGVSQVEVDLDDGRHVFLTVFDQSQIGAGNTVYQVVNQIERPAILTGRKNRRFDVTLLINGLPVVQIELKTDSEGVNDALNQMHQYIDENQYSDIFSTLQILVAMAPNDTRYMANTTSDSFNKDFSFNWQANRGKDPYIVRDWKEFADRFLSIPMVHKMTTNFMILDGTPNHESIKVMRPYQVEATQRVLTELKHVDFETGLNKVGYIWHTTGSGKTITSFKTAWLASRLPHVDKVVFLVDRRALTSQTLEKYRAYDPENTNEDSIGSITDTKNTNELSRKLKYKDNKIIITSEQKLEKLVKRKNFVAPDRNFVFIVDEAHRSTSGEAFKAIQKAFKNSAWIGYTGTPMFEAENGKERTVDMFGKCLHAYTIRNAIADRNVLGFKVDFTTTISEDEVLEKYLPAFYKEQHPDWDDNKIQFKIENITEEDMDDTLNKSFYDNNPSHVKAVVEDIFKNWKNRSNEGKYNAILTTHVGGGKPSIPMALMYYDEFQRINEINRANGGQTLKVAITFSPDSSNADGGLAKNVSLRRVYEQYNKEFNTSFDDTTQNEYVQDVMSRLNKSASDKNYLDLVIVVDQLLTGFDAPELNTLYVDRTLKGANLIQAYSRTNRIADLQEKPWGQIVNYRWPKENEKLMNEALAMYSNSNFANLNQRSITDQLTDDGILAVPFKEMLGKVKGTVEKLREMTSDFNRLPPSEGQKEEMLKLVRDYHSGLAKLKQYSPEEVDGEIEGYDYDHPEALIESLGMTEDENTRLVTTLTNELKEHVAKKKGMKPIEIDLHVTHLKDIIVNYDYLTELLEALLNQIHEDEMEEAEKTKKKIQEFANGLENRAEASTIMNAVAAIINKTFPPENSDLKYPYQLHNTNEVIKQARDMTIDKKLLDFRNKWGITDIVSAAELKKLFTGHQYEHQDLDNAGQLTNIVAKGASVYTMMSTDETVKSLKKVKYRNELRRAVYKFADDLIGEE